MSQFGYQSLGFGSGAGGAVVGGGFNIDVRDTEANILARTGDDAGVIAFGTDTHDLYVYDGANWQTYEDWASLASVDFDGTNDYCGAASDPGLDIDAISFWFNADSFSTNPMVVSGFGNGAYAAYGGFGISSAGDLRWDDGNYGTKYGSGFMSTGTWYHYCASFKASGYTLTDGTASNNGAGYEIYINGTRRDAAFSSTAAASYNFAKSSTTSAFKAGREGQRATYLFNGKIDEVAVFGSSLSSSDVTAIYNSGVPGDLTAYSPTLWWRMGDVCGSAGTNIPDQGSGGNDGTLTNGPTFSTDVPS